MSTKVSAIIISLILSLLIIFQNTTTITMRFLAFTFSINLGVLLFIAIVLGCIMIFNLFSIREDSYKQQLKNKNRQIANLKKENSKINVVNFGQDVNADTENEELYDKFKEAVTTESLSGDDYDDFEKKVDDYLTSNNSTFNYDDYFKTSEDENEAVENEKFPLSSFDSENFSLKSSPSNNSSSDESDEPWYMKPFFKRGKKLEQITANSDNQEEKKETKSLDDLIKLDLDDMSKSMGIKPHTKSSIADSIPALDNLTTVNIADSSENIFNTVQEEKVNNIANLEKLEIFEISETTENHEILEQEELIENISTETEDQNNEIIKDDTIKDEEDKNNEYTQITIEENLHQVIDTQVIKDDDSQDVGNTKENNDKDIQNLVDTSYQTTTDVQKNVNTKSKKHEKKKSKKKSEKLKSSSKKLQIDSTTNNKSKQQINEQPISTAIPPPIISNDDLKKQDNSYISFKPTDEGLKDTDSDKSFFEKIKSFKIFPKGFNWREAFKADDPDDELQV